MQPAPRVTDGTREQVSDACLKNRVGLETDGVFVVFGFQELKNIRRDEGYVLSEVASQLPIPVPGDNQLLRTTPLSSRKTVLLCLFRR
jgi:hypothetical protein